GLARYADREATGAKEGGLGSSVRREALRPRRGRSLLAIVEREVGAVGTMDEGEAAAPEPAGGGMHDADRRRRGDRRVDRRAPRGRGRPRGSSPTRRDGRRPGAERNADPGVVAGGGAAGRAATPGGTRPSARGTQRPGAGSRVSTRARGVGRHGAGGALGHDAARAALRPPRQRRPGGERLPAARGVARGGAPGLEARAPPPGRGTRRG